MGILKNIEKRMESLVEGVFGRAFRRQIHPVEIAKGLTKQMDEGRMVSISRTYAPNDFTVHLSKEDLEAIEAYRDALRDELIQYASTHAENKDYHLMTPPRVRFETDGRGRPARERCPAGHLGPDPHLPHRGGRPPGHGVHLARGGQEARAGAGGGGAGPGRKDLPARRAWAVDHRPLAGERHRSLRPERLEAAREALARRQRLRRRGSRFHQRDPPRWRPHRPRADRERRRADLRPDHRPLRPSDRLPWRTPARRK